MLKTVAVVLYFATVYVLIIWVTASFAITRHGPVKWASGWEYTVEHTLSWIPWPEKESENTDEDDE